MQVLHIITGLAAGGAERFLTNLIAALPQHRHVVVSLVSGGTFADSIAASGVRVIGLGLQRGLADGLTALPRLRRIVADTAADLVQGWMYHGNLAASLAARGRPVVWNIRQRLERLGDLRPATRLVVLAGVPVARATRAIVYNAAAAAPDHERLGFPRARRRIIPNGFDLTCFQPDPAAGARMRAALGIPGDAPLIGRVARDDVIKDTPGLLRAFAALPPDAHLALIGTGMDPTASRLAPLLQALGPAAAARVHALGERHDVAALVPGLDVLVMSSSHGEGFPNALGEAMACGVPAVATDVGACAEILGDPARIVPPRDPAALAAAIHRLIAIGPAGRVDLGARDRARVERHFAMPAVAERYAALWDDAARGGAATGDSGMRDGK